jgi:hypothetical protein
VGVLNVSVRICVCGRVRLDSHDPCEGREWWVDGDGRTWAAAVVECIGHVKEVERKRNCEAKGNEGSRKRVLKEMGSGIAKKQSQRGLSVLNERPMRASKSRRVLGRRAGRQTDRSDNPSIPLPLPPPISVP